jgi:LacI family transcriptional regulator
MYSSVASPYYALVMQGVTQACEERGYNLMLSPAKAQTPESYGKIIQNGFIDGLLVTTSSIGLPFLSWLHEQGFPFVLLGRQPGLPDVNNITSDNERGGGMAAQHLVWLGYRRIAIIAGPRGHGAADDRLNGFLHMLHEAGLECPDESIIDGQFSEHGGRAGMQQLLQASPRPEAVFCVSDQTAIGAMETLRQAGLRVPNDMAIVGFDDIPAASTAAPPLTTVRQPIEQIGYTATCTLIDILEARQHDSDRKLPVQHIVLPTELVVRDSCGQKRRFRAQRPAFAAPAVAS